MLVHGWSHLGKVIVTWDDLDYRDMSLNSLLNPLMQALCRISGQQSMFIHRIWVPIPEPILGVQRARLGVTAVKSLKINEPQLLYL